MTGPRFDWDAGNLAEIGRHGLSQADVQEVLADPRAIVGKPELVHGELRTEVLCATHAGRILVVVITPRGQLTRVVTAYPLRGRKLRQYLTGR